MKCKLHNLMNSFFMSSQQLLTVEITEGDARLLFDEFGRDRELELSLSLPKKKRSLTANAYAWELLGKLSSKLHLPVNDIYRHIIRELGGNRQIVQMPIKAVPEFNKVWRADHIGRFIDIIDQDEYTGIAEVCVYYGSSDFDTKTMSRFIDEIIFQCKEQGIETLPDWSKDALLKQWEERYART